MIKLDYLLRNTKVIDFVSSKINNYLYITSCPVLPADENSEVDFSIIFIFDILSLLIRKSLLNNDTIKVNLLDKEEINNRITNVYKK